MPALPRERCRRTPPHASTLVRSPPPQDEEEATEEDKERVELLVSLVESEVRSNRNFELMNAVLKVVLEVHTGLIQTDAGLRARCDRLRSTLGKTWARVGGTLNEVACMLGFFGNLQGDT